MRLSCKCLGHITQYYGPVIGLLIFELEILVKIFFNVVTRTEDTKKWNEWEGNVGPRRKINR